MTTRKHVQADDAARAGKRPSDVEVIPLRPAPPSSWHRRAWPTLDPTALHGLAGDVVRALEPHTEADQVAILVQLLVCFGNVIGRRPHAKAEADRHGMNEFAVLVGDSSKGRKGTSAGHIRALLRGVDAGWDERCGCSGLSSGEGIIWRVRDAIEKRTPVKDGDVETGSKAQVIDPGVADKRLLVLESEFASVLRVLERDGNTLSSIIRNAWDRGDLESLTKNSPARATGAHISIIGHITADELRRYLGRTEAGNGFANRFGWFCVKRSKCLPEGGTPDRVVLDDLVARLRDAVDAARDVDVIVRDREARALWASVYEALSAARPGMLGAATSRGEAHVLRYAAIYALLDGTSTVRATHIEAAHALWSYAVDSAAFIFGDALGDPMADAVLDALRGAGASGLSMTELHAHFRNNRNANDLRRALGMLLDHDLAHVRTDRTAGRPAERWYSRGTNKTNPTKEAPPVPEVSSSTSSISYPRTSPRASVAANGEDLDDQGAAMLAFMEGA